MAKILIGRFLESKYSVGKTAGQALDSLITELGESGFTALLVIKTFLTTPTPSILFFFCSLWGGPPPHHIYPMRKSYPY